MFVSNRKRAAKSIPDEIVIHIHQMQQIGVIYDLLLFCMRTLKILMSTGVTGTGSDLPKVKVSLVCEATARSSF